MLDDGICMGVRTFVEKFRVLSIEHRKRRGTVPVARSIPVAAVPMRCSFQFIFADPRPLRGVASAPPRPGGALGAGGGRVGFAGGGLF